MLISKNYYPCLICKTLFYRDDINGKDFILFKHLQFICPACKETIKHALKKED